MNNLQIEQFNKRLSELGKFTQGHEVRYKESEIIDWIADCVNIFYEIGIDSVIIRNFLDHFRSKTDKIEFRDIMGKKESETVKTIGPFREEVSEGMSGFRRYRSGYYILAGSFYYAKIAFSAARNALKNKIEEKRIVPLWLISSIGAQERLRHIASSLELIESKYEQKDAFSLVTESITLLDSVLNLDTDLRTKDSIGGKLNSLIENEAKRQTFGVSKDLVVGLNCGRILRNEKVIHKDKPLKYDIPFLIATSFAYLVLFFVECAILNGKVVTYEESN